MRVALVIWTDPRWYYAVIYTAQMLSEQGISVDLLHRNVSHAFVGDVDFGKNTRMLPVGTYSRGLRNRLDFAAFVVAAVSLIRHSKPDVVIGYDMFGFVAAFLATRWHQRATLIYHNFDLASRERLGPAGRLVKRLELTGARMADLVLFPSPGRAAIFKAEAGLGQDPLIVMNCHRLGMPEQKTGELDQLFRSHGLSFDRLVVRLGSIGPHHGIEATIRSVLEWNGNWGLVFVGVPLGSYLEEMRRLVASLNLVDRVVFLPSAPYSLWYDCLYSADLGIALYEPVNVNHAHMAGAGQKLYFYIKAGIPSIVPNLPDFVAFADRFGAGKVAEASDPHSIAQAINSILSDPEEYAAYCRSARQAFESELNFEKQFEPVLQQLVAGLA